MIEVDARVLAERLRRDFPSPRPVAVPDWRRTPASRVIDCVLSLRKSYERVVKPRVKRFSDEHPGVVTCADLRELIRAHPSPLAFHRPVLDMRSPGKAAMLVGVLDHLIDVQPRFDGETEDDRLGAWASWARPGDYLMLGVPGFGLAGFQYLRMLFGAQTTKPDVHILAYVAEALSRPPATTPGEQVRAVYTIERAGELLDIPVRDIDVAIWESRTGHSTTA